MVVAGGGGGRRGRPLLMGIFDARILAYTSFPSSSYSSASASASSAAARGILHPRPPGGARSCTARSRRGGGPVCLCRRRALRARMPLSRPAVQGVHQRGHSQEEQTGRTRRHRVFVTSSRRAAYLGWWRAGASAACISARRCRSFGRGRWVWCRRLLELARCGCVCGVGSLVLSSHSSASSPTRSCGGCDVL